MTLRTLTIGFGTVATAGLLGAAGHAQLTQSSAPPPPVTAFARQGGFFGGGSNGEQELVAQFDKDKDGRLNRAERDAARAATGGQQQFGFRRGFRFNQAEGQPGRRLTPDDVRPYPTTPIYDIGTLRTMFLQFEHDDWEDELAAFHNTDVEVPATMIVDGRTYKDVGVHFRGASSFMMVPEGLKRSLNVSTDFVHDQDLGGYKTFNLLNANNDPTFLRAFLYTEIARKYIPVPKMNFMRVVINGESWGIYLNTQQYNKDFLRDYFKTTQGARWKAPGRPGGRLGLEYLGEDIQAYRDLYEIKTKDDEASWKALVELTRVLNQTPPDKLEAALAPLLDVDGTLRFLALDVALVNSDGYWTRASDYSFYRHPDGRFHVIPHDVNEGLGGEGGRGFGGGGGARLDPLVGLNDSTKPLRSKLLAVPALREKYLGYVRDIAEKWLDWDAISPTVTAAHRLIAEEVRLDTRKLYDTPGFEAAVARTGNSLKDFFDERRAYLLDVTSARPAAVRAAVPSTTAEEARAVGNSRGAAN